MDTSTGLADAGALLVVHLPQRVRERTGGVDDALGPDVKLLPCNEDRDDEDEVEDGEDDDTLPGLGGKRWLTAGND